jgi:hypothetical protein
MNQVCECVATEPTACLLTMEARNDIRQSLRRLDGWLERHDYKGYDPFEGLSSRLRPLTFGSKFLRQCLVQFVRRCPVNPRPYLGIVPTRSTKGMGFLARGYLRWHAAAPNQVIAGKAAMCLEWLMANYSKGHSGYCWGNHFDYQTRHYYAPAGTPTLVWSSLTALTFVEAFERTGQRRYLEVARSTCEFIMRDLPRVTARSGICLSYIPIAESMVHNANMLGAALLARVFQHTGEGELKELARRALLFTAGDQNSDGSFYYGPLANTHWIDSWHTAYVIDSFDDYARATGDQSFTPVCRKGWEFFRKNFFLADGTPKYYSDRVFPIDIQCASQALETLCRFRAWDPTAIDVASKVALWTIGQMQDADGHFYFQHRPHWVNKTPTFHWGQATMLSGLATLLGTGDALL